MRNIGRHPMTLRSQRAFKPFATSISIEVVLAQQNVAFSTFAVVAPSAPHLFAKKLTEHAL